MGMKNNGSILLLSEYGRGEFTKVNNLITFDRKNSKLITRASTSLCKNNFMQFTTSIGYFYKFLDWNKNIKYAALFLENDQLVFNFEKNEYIIKSVGVSQFLLWKSIKINCLNIKVYSPIKTLFYGGGIFPEDVEPIFGQFKSLQTPEAIQAQIKFLKNKHNL